MIIDDAYLYRHMPAAEMILMNRIPPEEELDHQFSRRFCRKMKALLKYERRTPRERAVYRGMKLAFATLAVILLIVFGSAMTVKAYRFRFVEFIVEVFEDLTSYSVQEEKPDGEAVDLVEPQNVAKEYAIVNRIVDSRGFFIEYENENGERVIYRQEILSLFSRFWDTETCVRSEIYIGKQKVDIIEENDMWVVYWDDENYAYSITGAKKIALDELLDMARSIIK